MKENYCTYGNHQAPKKNYNKEQRMCDGCLRQFKDKHRNGKIPGQNKNNYLDRIKTRQK